MMNNGSNGNSQSYESENKYNSNGSGRHSRNSSFNSTNTNNINNSNHNHNNNNNKQLLKTEYPILIPYQVDFHTSTIGKHISLTKRVCVWRFGFAHIPSLLASKTGVACRGIEFEMKFIWSIASGKHEFYMNNVCVSSSMTNHVSYQQRSTNKMDQTFNIPTSILPGGHIVHFTLWSNNFALNRHINSNNNNDNNNNNNNNVAHNIQINQHNYHQQHLQQQNQVVDKHQQYTMRLDGQNYKSFCKIFELGNPQMMLEYEQGLNKLTAHGNGHANGHSHGNRNLYDNLSPTSAAHTTVSNHSAPSRINSDNINSNNNNNNNQDEADEVVRGRPRYNPNLQRPKSSQGLFNERNSNEQPRQHQHQNRYERSKIPPVATSPRKRFTKMWNNLDHRDIAVNVEEENKFLAKARINSFRDLRGEQQSYEKNVGNSRNQRQSHDRTQNQHQNQHTNLEDDNMSIPTFAKPPNMNSSKLKIQSTINSQSIHRTKRSPTNHNHGHGHGHGHGHHLKAVQETSDLLDGNNNNNFSSGVSEYPSIVRSTSSLTLDTLLRDLGGDFDGMTIATEQYSHLDPKQMSKTQQNISFRLQAPPVYADSSAGDLIQPTPSFGAGVGAGVGNQKQTTTTAAGINTAGNGHNTNRMNHNHQGQQQQFNNMNANVNQPMNFAQQQQNQQRNALNFAGRHIHTGMNSRPSSQPQQQQQQQQQQAGFVAPPAPTWDALNNAFLTPQQQQQQQQQQQDIYKQKLRSQQQKEYIRHLDPLSM